VQCGYRQPAVSESEKLKLDLLLNVASVFGRIMGGRLVSGETGMSPYISKTTCVCPLAHLPAAHTGVADWLVCSDSWFGSELAALALRAKFSLTELGTRVPLMIKVPWLTHAAGRRTVRYSMHRSYFTL
jgi:hypothetical protein